jgi:radical SAM-linked protein
VISTLNDESTEARQRWRLVFARVADAPESLMPGSPATETFVTRLEADGIVIARAGNRPRLALAAPLTVGMAGDRELADLFVTARHPVSSVRAAIEAALPAGHRLLDLHDAWLGEPALAAQLEAADYRIVLEPVVGGAQALVPICRNLIESESLPRQRSKGGRAVTYDLRPLVADLEATDDGSVTVLAVRTRFNPERGAGRPDEVLGAIAEAAGLPLTARQTTRVRLWLASELPPKAAPV